MMDEEISLVFVTLPQAMTTQSQVVATQAQVMAAQENREVGPHVQQNACATASRLMDFTRMNLLMFYASKVNEDSRDFIDEVYKIIYAIRLNSNETEDLASYRLKDVA